MKELSNYIVSVNTHGPHCYRKNGAGGWLVCETSEKAAHKALQRYFREHNITTSSGDVERSMTPVRLDILKRGECMKYRDFLELANKKEEPYQFSPKKTAEGSALRRSRNEGSSRDKTFVNGAFGQSDTYYTENSSICDVGDLPDISGVTFNGKPLSANNLENMISDLAEEILGKTDNKEEYSFCPADGNCSGCPKKAVCDSDYEESDMEME